VPILRALVEKGGRARVKDVLASVHADIVERLNDYDYQPVPSDSRRPRWVNGAMWCRKQLCEQGLLRADSPWGVWEITESGRRWLEEQA